MTRTTITPQLLHDFLEVHAIGADAPGGAGLVEDKSIDRDHSEVSINGVYDLSAVASELNTIDQTGTSHGRKQGMRRLLIVVGVLWFACWSICAYIDYQQYLIDLREYKIFGMPTLNAVYGDIFAAVLWPIIAYVVFLTVRWIWRGFRGNARA